MPAPTLSGPEVVRAALTNEKEQIQSRSLKPVSDDSVVTWHDVLIAHILLHEAEAFLSAP